MFTILTVCTGNLCRSAVAEQVLRARLADVPSIRVASAGTWASVGQPMPEQAQALSRSLGADPTPHVTESITPQHINSAGLVLVATREHRSALAEMSPRAVRNMFTMTQFARLADSLTDEQLAAVVNLDELIAVIASQRGLIRPAAPAEDDIEDPYRRSDETFRRVGAIIDTAMTSTVRVLRAVALRAA